jgi:hypothetical protein
MDLNSRVRIENKNYDGVTIETNNPSKKKDKVIFEKSCSSILLIIIF